MKTFFVLAQNYHPSVYPDLDVTTIIYYHMISSEYTETRKLALVI